MRVRVLLVVLAVFLLPGCSLLDSVSNSLNYVEEATTYINDASQFAEQLPGLAEQAVTDPQAREQLKTELENMRTQIANFNQLEAPAIAQDIHQKLVEYNEKLMTAIDGYMAKINNGVFDIQALKDSQILQTVEQITQILNQLQNLG
ncbi:DUF6376 family protein [Paenibacillus xerothermodurans]|uniref:Uncharacterized protein n=1 Tax=Paenibacillus xerothermodurans TaxID=1977292 RepID=A0A2W1N7X3_PAEXE|nr:DUF6376 family protein [Paenibacillus xerothermodurans]PZE19710.1 hypothetical protein CBW46_017430 [Paenibacillus xerothermodurans]